MWGHARAEQLRCRGQPREFGNSREVRSYKERFSSISGFQTLHKTRWPPIQTSKWLAQVSLIFHSSSNLKALCPWKSANNVCLSRAYQCLDRILTHHAINHFWLNVIKSCFVPNVLWIWVFVNPFLNQVSTVQSLSSFIRIFWVSVIFGHKLLSTTSKYNFETISVRIINKLAS